MSRCAAAAVAGKTHTVKGILNSWHVIQYNRHMAAWSDEAKRLIAQHASAVSDEARRGGGGEMSMQGI